MDFGGLASVCRSELVAVHSAGEWEGLRLCVRMVGGGTDRLESLEDNTHRTGTLAELVFSSCLSLTLPCLARCSDSTSAIQD